MSQLRQHQDDFESREVNVAVVSFDDGPLVRAYIQHTQLEWPILIDHDRQLYRSYGMDRGSWWTIYGPASIWQYLKLIFAGGKVGKPGKDWRQLGGDILIDPQGVVRFEYLSDSPHDRPSPEMLLAVLEST